MNLMQTFFSQLRCLVPAIQLIDARLWSIFYFYHFSGPHCRLMCNSCYEKKVFRIVYVLCCGVVSCMSNQCEVRKIEEEPRCRY